MGGGSDKQHVTETPSNADHVYPYRQRPLVRVPGAGGDVIIFYHMVTDPPALPMI
jgi:hypothetical protein